MKAVVQQCGIKKESPSTPCATTTARCAHLSDTAEQNTIDNHQRADQHAPHRFKEDFGLNPNQLQPQRQPLGNSARHLGPRRYDADRGRRFHHRVGDLKESPPPGFSCAKQSPDRRRMPSGQGESAEPRESFGPSPGSRTTAWVPSPSALLIRIVPCKWSRISLTMTRPRPVPSSVNSLALGAR